MKLLTLIKKNFNLLINAKFSSIVFIIGPLLLILVICLFLGDSSIKNVSSGVYHSPGVDEDVYSNFISNLKSSSFNVIEYGSLEKCKSSVREGDISVCIDIKKDSLDTLNTEELNYNYVFDTYVDFSQQRTVWLIIGTIQRIAEDTSTKMREEGISELKKKVSSYDSKIKNINERLDYLSSEISLLQTQLSAIQQNQNAISNNLNSIDTTINNLRNTISSIGSNLPSEYQYKIQDSLNYLQLIENSVGSIKSISENDKSLISQAQNELNKIESSINYLDDSITDLSIDLDQLQNSDLDKLANPIAVKSHSVLDGSGGNIESDLDMLDYLFPNFLLFFVLFSSITYGSINIIRERNSNAYVRNIASGLKGFNSIFSNFFTTFIIVLFQISMIILISSFFVNLNILGNVQNILVFLGLSISAFILIGILLGFLFNSNDGALVGGISVSLLFFMFSSLISPIETLPKTVSKVVSLTPFSIFENELRKILIFNSNIHLSSIQILSLGAFVVLTLILISIFYVKSREKEI